MVLFLDFGLHGFLGHCRWIQEGSSFQCGSKVWKGYQRRVKNVMSIISLNFADNQLTHIKSCKRPVDAWKTLCNIHKTKKLSNIFFVCHKFFAYNIQEGGRLFESHQQAQSICGPNCVVWRYLCRKKNILMMLLKSFLVLYEYLITTLEMMPMKKLTMAYVISRLMHEISKHIEK